MSAEQKLNYLSRVPEMTYDAMAPREPQERQVNDEPEIATDHD